MIQSAFSQATGYDPAVVHWITQLQNLLSQSYTEQAAYDFKQGFLRLSEPLDFDEESFEKILRTCVAISNLGRGKKGYVLVGVAENHATAQRIEELFSVTGRLFERFEITGIEHEASALGKSLDQFFQFITLKVNDSTVSEPLRSYLTGNLKAVRYYDKTVYVFEIIGQQEPSLFSDKYYERQGANVKEVSTAEFPRFYSNFSS